MIATYLQQTPFRAPNGHIGIVLISKHDLGARLEGGGSRDSSILLIKNAVATLSDEQGQEDDALQHGRRG